MLEGRFSGSVQSTSPEVLENIKRKNIGLDTMFQLAEEANEMGAESHSEVILGLPGDSAERHLASIAELEPRVIEPRVIEPPEL